MIKSAVKSKLLRTKLSLKANEDGSAPSEIELLRTGMWDAPYHGMFMVTPEDLQEYVQHFNDDLRPSSSTQGLPIDLEHEIDDGAVGWIMSLSVRQNETGGFSLWGGVTWTPDGAQALMNGEYKFFSPEFCPDYYIDPETGEEYSNVLIGGGLTNRPLFKDLKPVMASEDAGKSTSGLTDESQAHKIFIKLEGHEMPTLEEVKSKPVAELNEAERKLLADNKDQLTADERATYGLEEAPVAPVVPAVVEPVAPVAASTTKTGKVEVDATELESLKASAARADELFLESETKKAEELVDKQIARGAIKAGQKNDITGILLASSKAQRAAVEKFLSELPENKLVTAGEIGNAGGVGTGGTSAKDQLRDKATEIVKAHDGKLPYADAMRQAVRENSELAKQYADEVKAQNN